jgi:hypothetical protein
VAVFDALPQLGAANFLLAVSADVASLAAGVLAALLMFVARKAAAN